MLTLCWEAGSCLLSSVINLIVVSHVLCVTVVQGQKGWGVTYTSTEICAVKGSTVDLDSTCTYPSSINGRNTTVTKILWFVNGPNHDPQDLLTDPNYSGRVEYLHHDDNKYTLRITDLRESDSAEYKFRFITDQQDGRFTGLPGVTLKVTGKIVIRILIPNVQFLGNTIFVCLFTYMQLMIL